MEDGSIAPGILNLHYIEVSGHLHPSAALPSDKRNFSTHWIGGYVGTRRNLKAEGKRKGTYPDVVWIPPDIAYWLSCTVLPHS
jgi:hypothetical protein